MIKNNYKSGFTLIELLVSVSLFTIVITMAVGCLLVLIDANAKAQNMQQVMTNLSFAIDSMAREIRTGRSFYCSNSLISDDLDEDLTNDCTAGTYLSLVEGGDSLTAGTGNSRITFRYNVDTEAVERRVGEGSWFPITSQNVNITDMYFYVADTDTGRDEDDKQANVTIYIEGYSGALASVDSTFAVQATVAKRILDI